ncbi:glycosyltransferase family 4 protein [Parafrigoribacterium mesophilum]|uniref:glycosyltransferase n=1 Tax=Parafrigoribacterium mesophilum TaxID=433646 RepID=UPI0031FC9826
MVEQPGIVAVSRYGSSGASSRVRLRDWFEHFAINAEIHDYIGTANNNPRAMLFGAPRVIRAEAELRKLTKRLEDKSLVLSRSASPFSAGVLEATLLKNARHSVYDFDDAIYASGNHFFRNIRSVENVWTKSVRSADVVVAGSEVLAEAASVLRDDVVIIPSCVEPSKYMRKPTYDLGEIPRAVWIGSPGNEAYLLPVAKGLLALNTRFGLRLTVISAGNASLGELDKIVDRYTWGPDTFYEQIASADIGIMPLPNNPFTRGKCSYKLLQYGASGVPVIGSAVGANVAALQRLGGLEANTSLEWETAIANVLEMNPRERSGMGKSARDGVEKHYSFDAWARKWLEVMRLS